MPAFRLVHFGVWESGTFVGAIVYSRGGTPNLGRPFGLPLTQCVELVRVAMRSHSCPVSAALARSLHLLKQTSPGLRLVMSFADSGEGHHGGIYQAGNWLYLGATKVDRAYIVNGKKYLANALSRKRLRHAQGAVPAASAEDWARKVLDPNTKKVPSPTKHRYAYPLDRGMRRRLESLAQPYPRRAELHEAAG